MANVLDRYIGVLNVTFSKGPKQLQSSAPGADKKDKGHGAIIDGQKIDPPQNGNGPMADAEPAGLAEGKPVSPRIVSHSQQQTGEMAQVILDQNKHIIPASYFGLPERPRSADPHHGRQSADFGSVNGGITSRPGNVNGQSPHRPAVLEHSMSWGTTTANAQLKDKVFRDVFGPLPTLKVHRKVNTARPNSAHSTLPRTKDPSSRRRSNLSQQSFDSTEKHDSRVVRHTSSSSTTVPFSPGDDLHLCVPSKDVYSSSASTADDVKNSLEMVRATTHIGSDESNGSFVRRRHSGSGLRRRRQSLSGTERPNLEYFEEAPLASEPPDEVFSMEEDSTAEGNPARKDDTSTSETSEAEGLSLDEDEVAKQAEDDIVEHLPSNPKEAQLSTPDQRVAFFILLEDLTTGMGRPCVLDLKMGTRQYGIEATKKKMESQRRKCKTTTSQQLGVRVCGMQTFNAKTKEVGYEDKYFGRDVRVGREFRDALTRFLYDGIDYSSVAKHIPTLLTKLSKLENIVRRLPGYRFYASSLLLFYDAEPYKSRDYLEAQKNGIDLEKQRKKEGKKWPPPIEMKLVDFANCVTGEDPLPAQAQAPPQHPGEIDRGYLRGLRTLKAYFRQIVKSIQDGEVEERGEVEAMDIRGRVEAGYEKIENNGDDVQPPDDDDGEVSI